jgi:hypothetical protein
MECQRHSFDFDETTISFSVDTCPMCEIERLRTEVERLQCNTRLGGAAPPINPLDLPVGFRGSDTEDLVEETCATCIDGQGDLCAHSHCHKHPFHSGGNFWTPMNASNED